MTTPTPTFRRSTAREIAGRSATLTPRQVHRRRLGKMVFRYCDGTWYVHSYGTSATAIAIDVFGRGR